MFLRLVLCLSASVLLGGCVSSVPTADVMDDLEKKVRAEYRPHYADLEDQRRSGTMTPEEYISAKNSLDKRVQSKVDTMLWSRHALVQSDMKANGLPTPDRPQSNDPPGVGTLSGTLYNSNRQSGLGNQSMDQMVRSGGNSLNNARRAGTMYDQ